MAVSLDSLVIKVKLDTREFDTSLNRLKGRLGQFDRATANRRKIKYDVDTTEVSRGLDDISRMLDRSGLGFTRVFQGLSTNSGKAAAKLFIIASAIGIIGKTATGAASAFGDLFFNVKKNIKAFEELRTVSAQFENIGLDLEYAVGQASELGVSIDSLGKTVGLIDALTDKLGLEQAVEVSEKLSKALLSRGLSSNEFKGAINALSQMGSKGVVSMEELRRQLGERLPGAIQIAAQSMGMTTEAFSKLVSTGQVLSEDFLPKFAAEMEKTTVQMERLESNSLLLANAITQIRAEVGESTLKLQSALIQPFIPILKNVEAIKIGLMSLGAAIISVSAAVTAKLVIWAFGFKAVGLAAFGALDAVLAFAAAVAPIAIASAAIVGLTAAMYNTLSATTETTDAIQAYRKELEGLASSLDAVIDKEEDAANKRGAFGRVVNTLSFGGLDRLDESRELNAAGELADDIFGLLDATAMSNAEIEDLATSISTLQGEVANLELDKLTLAAAGASGRELAAIQQQIIEKNSEIADGLKNLSVPLEVRNSLRELVESGKLTGAALQQAINLLALLDARARQTEGTFKDLTDVANLFNFDRAIATLDGLQADLNSKLSRLELENVVTGIDVSQEKLNALQDSLEQEEITLQAAVEATKVGFNPNIVDALSKRIGKDVFSASTTELKAALSDVATSGEKSSEKFQAILKTAIQLNEREDALIKKKIKAASELNKMTRDLLRAGVAQDLSGVSRIQDFVRNLELELDAQIDASSVKKLENSIKIINARMQLALDTAATTLESISARYPTALKNTLLRAANATGVGFEEFARNLGSAQVDNLRAILATEIKNNPALGDLLDNLDDVSDAFEESKELQVSLNSSIKQVRESYKDNQEALEDFNDSLEDTVQGLEAQIASNELDTAFNNLSLGLNTIVNEQDSIFGQLSVHVKKAAQAHIEGEKATLSYEQEVRSNAERVQELTEQYGHLMSKQAELGKVVAALTYNMKLAANQAAKQATGGGGGTPTFAIPGQTLGTSTITSGFGMRNIFGRKDFHEGIDIGVGGGTQVVSMFDGLVKKIKPLGDQMQVMVEHVNTAGEKVQSWYIHLDRSLDVVQGQAVKAGQALGTVAKTSADARRRRISTGDHLDFRQMVDGVWKDPMTELARQFELAQPMISEAVVTGAKEAAPFFFENVTPGDLTGLETTTAQANESAKALAESRAALAMQELLKDQKNLMDSFLNTIQTNEQLVKDIQNRIGSELSQFDIGNFVQPTQGEEFLAQQSKRIEDEIIGLFTKLDLDSDDIMLDVSGLEAPVEKLRAKFEAVGASGEFLEEAIQQGITAFNDTKQTVGELQDAMGRVAEGARLIDQAIFQEQRTEALGQIESGALDDAIAAEQSRLGGGSDQTLLELNAARELNKLLEEREERLLHLDQLKKDAIITEQEHVDAVNRLNQSYAQQESSIIRSTTQIGQFADTARTALEQGLQSNLTSFFQNQQSGWEMLRGIALDVLNSIAAKAAEMATQSIIDGIFGGIGGGGLFGGIFNMGGKVDNYAMGGEVPTADKGLGIMTLGMGVAQAMKKEGAGAVPIVAHAGEWVLSDKTGDAQLYERLKMSGQWDSMKTVSNFQLGGKIGSAGAASRDSARTSGHRNKYGAKEAIVVNNTFNVKDYNSFNRSREEMARRQKAELDYASKRG